MPCFSCMPAKTPQWSSSSSSHFFSSHSPLWFSLFGCPGKINETMAINLGGVVGIVGIGLLATVAYCSCPFTLSASTHTHTLLIDLTHTHFALETFFSWLCRTESSTAALACVLGVSVRACTTPFPRSLSVGARSLSPATPRAANCLLAPLSLWQVHHQQKWNTNLWRCWSSSSRSSLLVCLIRSLC